MKMSFSDMINLGDMFFCTRIVLTSSEWPKSGDIRKKIIL
jgi:hypothetical protein